MKPLSKSDKPVRYAFPGPRGATAPLRVAVERAAYADLIAHAKESLEAEVCGVLAGHICEDDRGLFVHVEAVIRGNAANESATHVTFTQATWDAIHLALERDHPKLRIVGWYHTHPGFGVEFSEMDLFIQQNFFSGPTQIALVTDPLSGAVAIATNTSSGIEYLPRYWVDGREQLGHTPVRHATVTNGEPAEDLLQTVKALEARVAQLIQSQDDLQTLFHRVVLTIGFVACLAIIGTVGYFVYQSYTSRFEPPRLNSFVPVPIQIGDKSVLIGVGVVQWDVPPELNSVLLQMEQLKRDAAAKEAAAKALIPAPAATPTPSPTKPDADHERK